jgi:hypothetical protein
MANGATIVGSAAQLSPIVRNDSEAWVEIVERQVRALKFGSVQITVHDGRVVQVETSSKIRFDKT